MNGLIPSEHSDENLMGFGEENCKKMYHCILFYSIVEEVISKTRTSGFIRGSKHQETIKALGLRPRAFICFWVFGTPDETLALVFDILLKAFPFGYHFINSRNLFS